MIGRIALVPAVLGAASVCSAVCTPVLEWVWDGSIESPSSPDPCVTPLVLQLTDDNADGRIDACDMPDVVFNHGQNLQDSYLTAVDGATMAEHFTVSSPALVLDGLAGGDIDGDGLVELIGLARDDRSLIAFEHDGTFKWQSDPAPADFQYHTAIGIADLDQDGSPELFVGANVFNADGTFRFRGSAGLGKEPIYRLEQAVAVDLVPGNPGLELVAGRTAYAADGSVVWDNPALPDGHVAVADFDGDGDPEVVLATARSDRLVYLLDHLGNELGPPHVVTGTRRPFSVPLVADIDGDGQPEVVIVYDLFIEAIDWNGSGFDLLWRTPTSDGSGATGASAFDFDGDGAYEIVYTDEQSWYLFDGRDGSVYYSEPLGSVTLIELPVIADIDGDDRTELTTARSQRSSRRHG